MHTPIKPDAAPDAVPLTPVMSVNRMLPLPPESPRSRGTDTGSADCVVAATTRCSSSAPTAALLESPVRRRQAALTGLQAAKAEMAYAMEQLRACACELRIQLPANSAGGVAAHSP